MLSAHSPLVGLVPVTYHATTLSDAAGFTLTQVAGADKALKKALGKLPTRVGVAVESEDQTLFRVGPKQVWVLGAVPDSSAGVYVTPLSSGRTRVLLEGGRARDVLSACALIDFHVTAFKPGQFVMTGIHHTPVVIHCIGAQAFHIYAMRSFALNVWEWLADQMQGLSDDRSAT